MSPSKKILFLLSGSIAVTKSIKLIELFKKNNFEIRIACTETTFEFIKKQDLEALSDGPLIHKNFQNQLDMQHIDLGRWADLTLFCPATANSINQLAQGSGDNIVGTLFLAYELGKKPFLIAPAMNTQMYQNPATQQSLQQLKNWGLEVLPTNVGALACGEFGEGRMLEPDFLFNYINNNYFSKQHKQKILITAGATKESIDGVRFITNFSTGKTGAKIADHFTALGHDVTLLKAENAQKPKYCKNIFCFSDFKSLNNSLKGLLAKTEFDAVVMTAAISDFSVDTLLINDESQEISDQSKLSSQNELTIKMKKNFKIIDKLKSYSSNKEINIIAFKLTKTKSANEITKSVEKLTNNPDINFVIQNDLNDIESGNHLFNIYNQSGILKKSLSFYDFVNELKILLINKNQSKVKNEVTI